MSRSRLINLSSLLFISLMLIPSGVKAHPRVETHHHHGAEFKENVKPNPLLSFVKKHFSSEE